MQRNHSTFFPFQLGKEEIEKQVGKWKHGLTIKKTKQIPAIIRFRLIEWGKAGSAIPVTGFLSIDGALSDNQLQKILAMYESSKSRHGFT